MEGEAVWRGNSELTGCVTCIIYCKMYVGAYGKARGKMVSKITCLVGARIVMEHIILLYIVSIQKVISTAIVI